MLSIISFSFSNTASSDASFISLPRTIKCTTGSHPHSIPITRHLIPSCFDDTYILIIPNQNVIARTITAVSMYSTQFFHVHPDTSTTPTIISISTTTENTVATRNEYRFSHPFWHLFIPFVCIFLRLSNGIANMTISHMISNVIISGKSGICHFGYLASRYTFASRNGITAFIPLFMIFIPVILQMYIL